MLSEAVLKNAVKERSDEEEVRQSVAPAEPVQYYFTLAQQPAGAVQVQPQQQGQAAATPTNATTLQPGQIIITQPQQGQRVRRSSAPSLALPGGQYSALQYSPSLLLLFAVPR
ncbi:hypothetical protein GN956_G26791 [Arapaima gigas]